MEWIIGGPDRAGQGWRMLMNCLAAGRAVSLPATSAAAAKAVARHSTAYARVRKQFGLPIGFMEGVEEPLARLVENAYGLEAARAVTCSMVSAGEKPAVISALLKYLSTARMRESVNDALDIHGGRGICDGPSNYSAERLSDGARRHHGGGRQYPDPLAHRLCARGATQSPLPAFGDRSFER